MICNWSHLHAQTSVRAIIPFENHCGKMIVSLKINNFQEPLRFLFDTGADGMAVSTELAEKIGLKVTRSNNAAVVGGNMDIKVSDGNEIHFGGFSMQRMGIAIFEKMDKGVSGILGNTFLRRYVTEIDYDKNEIRLYDFGKSAPMSAGQSVDVKVPNGLLLVPVSLSITNEKIAKGNFVFDSGASYGLICFRNFVQKHKLLVSGFVSKYVGSTVSMGMQSATFTGIAQNIQLGAIAPGTSWPVTLMSGLLDSDKDLPHDGSLGVRLLSRYNILINLQQGKAFFTPNKLSHLPPDFMIGTYVLGWDNMEVLRVVGGGPETKTGAVFPEGTEVAFIDKMEPSDLLKNKGKRLNKLMASGKPIQMQLRVNGALVTYTGK